MSVCQYHLLIQSHVEGDLTASIRKVRVALTNGLHLSKLRPPAPDVVLVAGRDLATEVELTDEGLALWARRHHLDISENKIVQKSMLAPHTL